MKHARSFLDLPPEIRLQVYRYLLPEGVKFVFPRSESVEGFLRASQLEDYKIAHQLDLALTGICRTIRQETLSILYGRNIFEYRSDACRDMFRSNFYYSLDPTIGVDSIAYLKNVEIFVRFNWKDPVALQMLIREKLTRLLHHFARSVAVLDSLKVTFIGGNLNRMVFYGDAAQSREAYTAFESALGGCFFGAGGLVVKSFVLEFGGLRMGSSPSQFFGPLEDVIKDQFAGLEQLEIRGWGEILASFCRSNVITSK